MCADTNDLSLLEPDSHLTVSYGSRQLFGKGEREKQITVLRESNTSETDYYRGYNPQDGVWVLDGDKEKFFLYSRFISIRKTNLYGLR